MSDKRLAWMEEENDRAEENLESGTTENGEAPIMVKKKTRKAPDRTTRGIFVQDKFWNGFEDVVLAQKRIKGKTKPELAEEALQYIIDKYKK